MPQIQLITDVTNIQRNNFTAATATLPNKIVTVSKPASTANSTVVGPGLNYLKMKFHSDSTIALTISVFGWSFAPVENVWVPHLICTLTTTQGGSSQTIPGITAPQFEVTAYVPTSGDAKIYSTPATVTSGAFVMVDTLGSEFVEIYASAASTTPVVYVWTASI